LWRPHELAILRVRRHRANGGIAPLVFHASGFHGLAAKDEARGAA
jgi:hypothetical protein